MICSVSWASNLQFSPLIRSVKFEVERGSLAKRLYIELLAHDHPAPSQSNKKAGYVFVDIM